MYEDGSPSPTSSLERIRREASQFVSMMYDLWDESRAGTLDAAGFDRAAHQHPLLVQAFQLEQIEQPPSTTHDEGDAAGRAAGAPSATHTPAGTTAHLRVKNGVYLGLRPGAVCKLDDSYF
jgi:hypothetical protein